MSAEVFQTDLFAKSNPLNLCIQPREVEIVIASAAKQSPLLEQASETVSKPKHPVGNAASLVAAVCEPSEMGAQRPVALCKESLRRPFIESFQAIVVYRQTNRNNQQIIRETALK
jgi:hypothetical protein